MTQSFIANDYINIHSCTKEQNRKVDSRIESGLIKKLKTFSITGVVPVFKEEEQELMRKAKENIFGAYLKPALFLKTAPRLLIIKLHFADFLDPSD